MTQLVTKPKEHRLRNSLAGTKEKRPYDEAWNQFWQLGDQLRKLWKTKKTSLQILREERDSW